MAEGCTVCGESDQLLRDCKYCTGVYCSEHTLPKNHDCPGLQEIDNEDGWFRDEGAGVPTKRGKNVRPRPEPLNSDEVTTYGSTETDFESSPDVNADGSIAGRGGGSDEQMGSETGSIAKLVSALKFWS
ncbi:AN1-type zinc finger domain-containing protein [Halorientalis marina]|uniref:AN1-type zinc finger domain-containing protein n=1 Tax=Halorientalis marina TaxID=2931976 RepID=UPI003563783A